MHTFASMAGAQLPDDRKMDSYDLSPILLEGMGESPRTAFFYWNRGELHAARSGPWKIHLKQRAPINYGMEVVLESPELYNIETDLSEQYECAEAFPEKLEELLQLCKKHQADITDALPDNLVIR